MKSNEPVKESSLLLSSRPLRFRCNPGRKEWIPNLDDEPHFPLITETSMARGMKNNWSDSFQGRTFPPRLTVFDYNRTESCAIHCGTLRWRNTKRIHSSLVVLFRQKNSEMLRRGEMHQRQDISDPGPGPRHAATWRVQPFALSRHAYSQGHRS